MAQHSDPVLSMLLSEAGCPYPEGSTDSVVWLQGYKAGLQKELALRPRMSDPLQTERRSAPARKVAG